MMVARMMAGLSVNPRRLLLMVSGLRENDSTQARSS
jgi:hypothetical protein